MNSYGLVKIKDLLSVPIDRREVCVKDLLHGLALHELAFGEDAQKVEIGSFIWTDDGNHSVDLTAPDGAHVLSLKITKDAP